MLFCSLFLNSDYTFSNFSGNFLFADQRGILSNHRSYCASMCMPLIGPHMINFLSVIICSFYPRERAPLELEGSFCHKNSPSILNTFKIYHFDIQNNKMPVFDYRLSSRATFVFSSYKQSATSRHLRNSKKAELDTLPSNSIIIRLHEIKSHL